MQKGYCIALYCFLFSLLGSGVVDVHGQTLPTYRVDPVELPGDIAGNSVNNMVQDKEGYLWFSSQDGLHRFDEGTGIQYDSSLKFCVLLILGGVPIIYRFNINLDSSKYNNVHICAYNINNDSIFPFQRFLLENSIDEKLKFPNFKNIKIFSLEELINYAKVFLFGLLKINDYDKFDEIILLDGYLDYDNDLYIFFDITLVNIKLDYTYAKSHLFLILIDEILKRNSQLRNE
jgi:hypothetical protein